MQPSAFCFDDQKCLKLHLAPPDFGMMTQLLKPRDWMGRTPANLSSKYKLICILYCLTHKALTQYWVVCIREHW